MPVAVTGFSWGTMMLGVANALLGGVLVALIRTRPTLKKIANDREANLLEERANDMEAMRAEITKLNSRLDAKDALHEAERAYDRHRINNLDACLNAFLMLVKANPDDAAKAAEMIEEMRAKQVPEERKEAIALRQMVARQVDLGGAV